MFSTMFSTPGQCPPSGDLRSDAWKSRTNLLPNEQLNQNPGCLGSIGDEILPSCIGIIINHYKDPY